MAEETNIKFPLSSTEIENKERLYEALHAFDVRNTCDPNTIEWHGTRFPYELFYASKLFERVLILDSNASEALMLASRCQHLCRWYILRNTFPDGRSGYLDWREALKVFHADEAAKILDDCGYDDGMKEKVRELNLKKDIKGNPDCQTLEDALCIIFLTHQLDDMIEKYPDAKVVSIIKKTAGKMSEQGLDTARDIAYCDKAKTLVIKALS